MFPAEDGRRDDKFSFATVSGGGPQCLFLKAAGNDVSGDWCLRRKKDFMEFKFNFPYEGREPPYGMLSNANWPCGQGRHKYTVHTVPVYYLCKNNDSFWRFYSVIKASHRQIFSNHFLSASNSWMYFGTAMLPMIRHRKQLRGRLKCNKQIHFCTLECASTLIVVLAVVAKSKFLWPRVFRSTYSYQLCCIKNC